MNTRKYVTMLIVFALAFAVGLAVTGCKKEADQPPDETRAQTAEKTDDPVLEPGKPDEPAEKPVVGAGGLQVVPLVGVGAVKFGMSKEEVIKSLGRPERDERIALYYLGSKGIHIVLNPRTGVSQIHCWSKDFPMPPPEALTTFVGKTEQGIGMGSSREQIVAAYGRPDTDDAQGGMGVLSYKQLKIDFTLSQNKVVSLRMEAP
jgi:hypothetical protein